VSDQELCALYGAASAVVAPSLGEGFDLPVLEALACGAVVVTSNIPVHVEHFAGAVELFDSGDAESLTNSCLRVLTDTVRDASLREQGLYLASKFSWKTCARRHLELWQTVVGV
jgi:glycosyltransferase involved in cell wall biosynthesis